MKQFSLLLITFACLASCSETPKVQSEHDLLKQYCRSTATADYYTALGEIIPDSLFEGKAIIACGQSTHGSKENFEIQAELFKRLVKTQDCRTFVMEGNYASILWVNSYVHDGFQKKDEVMRSLGFWTWDTEEVWQLIEWVKDYNLSVTNDQTILFLGNDMQEVNVCAKGALGFFLQFGGQYSDSAFSILYPLTTDSSRIFTQKNEQGDPLFQEEMAKLEEWAGKIELPHGESKYERYRLGKYSLTILKQSLQLANAKPENGSTYRDSAMAENVRSIDRLGLRNGSIYIWAHNYHIANAVKYGKRMGTYLSEWYEGEYLTLAVDFSGDGSFNARQPIADSVGPMIEYKDVSRPVPCSMAMDTNCLGYKCDQKENGLTFFNSGASAEDGAFRATTIYQQARMHTIGAIFDSATVIAEPVIYVGVVDLSRDYDGIIFYWKSTPTQLLNTPKEKPRHH